MSGGTYKPGALLLAEIEDWCSRHGVSEHHFGVMAPPNAFPGFIGLLRKRGTATLEMAAAVRGFMARWPDGCTVGQAEAWKSEQGRQRAARANDRTVAVDDAPPETLPAETGVARAARAEAEAAVERRRGARRLGGTVRAGNLGGIAERVQTLALESPADVVLLLKRRWPELWAGVLASARAAGCSPVAHLVTIVAAGVGQSIEAGGGELAA